MKIRILPAALALSLLPAALLNAPAAHADEGMWQPSQMPELAGRLKALGLRMEPEALSDLAAKPLDAVISLGGCTASFVSPRGLVVTNHHCAYGNLQYNSTPERDLLADGFVARDLAEELPAAPTSRIYVTQDIRDVTAQVTDGLEGMDGKQRFDAIESRSKALVAGCEAPGGLRCNVYNFHGGLQFSLIRQLEIQDVRLVYAPSELIGKFGGDEDNFEWPRHTGDWAFLRAYVGPDGKPAPYSEGNVPFEPASWLTVSQQPLVEGDYVMVTGYPGRTNRYRLADEVEQVIDWQYPVTVQYLRDSLETIERTTAGDRAAALKYASTVAGYNNVLKLYQGNLDGFARMEDPVGMKRDRENALRAWLADGGARGRETIAAIDELARELEQERTTRERDLWLGNVNGGLAGVAVQLYRNALEQAKPDAERKTGYQERDAARLRGALEAFDKRYDPAVDRALMALRLQRYAERVPAAQRVPELDAWLGIGAADTTIPELDARLDALYASALGDQAERLRWLQADAASIEASADPALQFAVGLMPVLLADEELEEARAGRVSALRPQFMQAMIDFNADQGRAVYPDANSSLRITFGTVRGYSPRDGVRMVPFTTLDGLVAKVTGKEPFASPQSQLDAIAEGRGAQYRMESLGDVPVNFLSDVDTTGGNSGSPTLNADGELVGLLFDGNYESLNAGWIFNPELTRSIHVDTRYMRWVMDEVDHAEHLLEEMGLPHD
ncbi:S46 family peptidase [Lysobacter sp. GX 14042]|uniref:S46 family peptidase n=1 Tax=Lysobacter sp. GX 14042 TaxID=2907155 RepID=UPI001F3C33DC|nr:S46 family peptidase [Lysobacter sp. GX 14042]MCE7033267.1 S46 family peptidase [Lysobacter sp. GX 14042]